VIPNKLDSCVLDVGFLPKNCNVLYMCVNRTVEFSDVRRAARVPQRASVVGVRSPGKLPKQGKW